MTNLYPLRTTPEFERKYDDIISKNFPLKKRIDSKLLLLKTNPFYVGLKTHKVFSNKYGENFSSRLTGDLRVLWTFIYGKTVILAITLGGHSGKKSVYK